MSISPHKKRDSSQSNAVRINQTLIRGLSNNIVATGLVSDVKAPKNKREVRHCIDHNKSEEKDKYLEKKVKLPFVR